jgi:transketolase
MTLPENTIKFLETRALKVREHIIRMSTNGGCFLGASLSCADLLVYLYSGYQNIHRDNLKDPQRDYLFLSKGHDVPALYSTLAEVGILEKHRLQNHLSVYDHLYWHPNTSVPGIEYYSGSLGHLLSVAIGVAIDCKLRKTANRIIVILGDGELNEGSVWEGLLVGNAYKLDNLLVIVDRNQFQANLHTEELIPLEPLETKLESFGWTVKTINGHDFSDIHDGLLNIISNTACPQVIIADTIRGKGLPSIENRADRWFCNFTRHEIDQLLNELHTNKHSHLNSESLMVR